jgi:hypothetical protein
MADCSARADMASNTESTIRPYEIVSVDPADPPDGMDGDDWFCYVISQGNNKIEGFRQGKPRAVKKAVEEIVAQVNERHMGKRGRVNLVPTPKPAAKK